MPETATANTYYSLTEEQHADVIRRAMKLAKGEYMDVVRGQGREGGQGPHNALQRLALKAMDALGYSRVIDSQYAAGVGDREDRDAMAIDLFEGRALPWLDMQPGEADDAGGRERFMARLGKFTMSVVRAFVRELSRVYVDDATRTITGKDGVPDEEATTRYEGFVKACDLHGLLGEGEKYDTLTGGIATRLHWLEAENRADPEILTTDRVRVVDNSDDPARPHAWIIRWRCFDAADGKEVTRAVIWTEREYLPLKNGGIDAEAIDAARESWGAAAIEGPSGGLANPYKVRRTIYRAGQPAVMEIPVLPIVGKKYRRVVGGQTRSWHADGEGQSLADFACEINNALAALGNTIHMQGHAQVVTVNAEDGADVRMGPAVVTKIRLNPGEQGGIQTLAYNAPISEIFQVIADMVNLEAECRGIPKSRLHAEADASGVAIVAAQGPLAEHRKDQIGLWDEHENRVSISHAAVESFHRGEEPPLVDDWRLSIDRVPPSVSLTEQEQRERDDWRMENGLTDPVEIELRENGDAYAAITDDDKKTEAALAKLIERRERTKKVRSAGAMVQLDTMGNPIAPDQPPGSEPDPNDPDGQRPGDPEDDVNDDDADPGQ